MHLYFTAKACLYTMYSWVVWAVIFQQFFWICCHLVSRYQSEMAWVLQPAVVLTSKTCRILFCSPSILRCSLTNLIAFYEEMMHLEWEKSCGYLWSLCLWTFMGFDTISQSILADVLDRCTVHCDKNWLGTQSVREWNYILNHPGILEVIMDWTEGWNLRVSLEVTHA